MNKFLTTVVSLATLGCVAFGATACGMSTDGMSTDPDEVMANLKENHYSVYFLKDTDDDEAMLVDFYGLDVDEGDTDLVVGIDELIEDKIIYMVFCKDEEIAEDLYEQAEKLFEEWCEVRDWKEEDYSIGINGTVAYFGYNDAIEAAKG